MKNSKKGPGSSAVTIPSLSRPGSSVQGVSPGSSKSDRSSTRKSTSAESKTYSATQKTKATRAGILFTYFLYKHKISEKILYNVIK